MKKFECLRCGHKWFPRKEGLPVVCPSKKCHSPYWHKQKVEAERSQGVLNQAQVEAK
jgi:hypothetical protein